MIISKKQLLGLFEGCYEDQLTASELNKATTQRLKDFAEDQKLNEKAVKAGYKVYKDYMKGTVDPDDEDFLEISTIVEDAFGG